MDTLHTEITKRLPGKTAPFAVFDFDNTCIAGDIGEAVFAYLCKGKLLKDTTLLSGAGGDYHEAVFTEYYRLLEAGEIHEAYMLIAKIFSGFTPQEAADVTRAAIQAEGREVGTTELYGVSIARGLAPRPEVIELMQFLKTCGVDVWVVSASTEVAVRAAMEHFGIEAKVIGVRSVVAGGVFTSALEAPMPIVEGKVDCMRVYINPTEPPLVVVDDSMTGLPLLETADIKVVVQKNPELVREAARRGWYVL